MQCVQLSVVYLLTNVQREWRVITNVVVSQYVHCAQVNQSHNTLKQIFRTYYVRISARVAVLQRTTI